jgi:hypothetical protein
MFSNKLGEEACRGRGLYQMGVVVCLRVDIFDWGAALDLHEDPSCLIGTAGRRRDTWSVLIRAKGDPCHNKYIID